MSVPCCHVAAGWVMLIKVPDGHRQVQKATTISGSIFLYEPPRHALDCFPDLHVPGQPALVPANERGSSGNHTKVPCVRYLMQNQLTA